MIFKGVFTAIVTPFKEDESIDKETLKNLIEINIKGGVSGIVPCGTTGESPTLTHEEKLEVIKLVVEQVNGRVPVIAGTGSNSTKASIEMSKEAEEIGVDALLIVNPYYNKPTQEGLYLHFKSIADSVKIPIIVYNIKGRTAVNVETQTLVRLMKDCDNIVAVKEASGDIMQMKEVIANKKEGFSVLSGDDGITLELIKAGGDGVISVASNIAPDRMSNMVKIALEGNIEEAEKLNQELRPLFDVEFIETNPIPIKYMLSKKGLIKESYRLPMCKLSDDNKGRVDKVIEEMKL